MKGSDHVDTTDVTTERCRIDCHDRHACGHDSRAIAAKAHAPRGDVIDPVNRGFGIGVIAGGSAEAGLVAGAGATASAGAGAFFGQGGAPHVGAFASGGAFAGVGSGALKAPSSSEAAGALGAFAGVGIGVFATNARSAADLSGVAPTYSLNLGEGM